MANDPQIEIKIESAEAQMFERIESEVHRRVRAKFILDITAGCGQLSDLGERFVDAVLRYYKIDRRQFKNATAVLEYMRQLLLHDAGQPDAPRPILCLLCGDVIDQDSDICVNYDTCEAICNDCATNPKYSSRGNEK